METKKIAAKDGKTEKTPATTQATTGTEQPDTGKATAEITETAEASTNPTPDTEQPDTDKVTAEITGTPEYPSNDQASISDSEAGTPSPPELVNMTSVALAIDDDLDDDEQWDPDSRPLDGYLSEGYYKGEGKGRYMDPALFNQAEVIGMGLAASGMKQSAFNPILRELKRANKKALPLEAKRGALAGAILQAKQLVQRHRAPDFLVFILKRNCSAVLDDNDYTAAVKHLAAVSVFLGDYQE